MDETTKEICEEVSRIRQMIPTDLASLLVIKDTWQKKWSKLKEDTSSSYSGLHFGHYISGAESDLISKFHAMKTSIALKEDIAMSCWSNGLSVMPEKMFIVRLVSKLRAILLMEADFNAANKIVYGNQMLENTRKYSLMPEYIFSERNMMADDGGLAKIILYDIVRQRRVPAVIASVDAANC